MPIKNVFFKDPAGTILWYGRETYEGLDQSASGLSEFLHVAKDFHHPVLFHQLQVGIDGEEHSGSTPSITIESIWRVSLSLKERERGSIEFYLQWTTIGPELQVELPLRRAARILRRNSTMLFE